MTRTKPLKLLLVDNDEDDYDITRYMLSQARPNNFSLEWAASYEAGRAALQADHFDAVLVDYDLGAHTGIQLIREAVAQGHPTPLILFTGRGSFEVDMEAMQAGATLYLTKSEATPLLLERAIRYAIERKQGEEKLRAANAALEQVNQALQHELNRRRLAEEALNATAKRFQAVFESSPVSIWEEDFSEVNAYFQELRRAGVRDFAAYFDAHPDAVFECANRVRVMDVNQTSINYFQASSKAELTLHLPRYFCEESFSIFKQELVTLAGGGTTFSCETPTCLGDGERRIVELHLSVVPGFEDTLARVLVSFFDVSDRKQTEQALRESEERYRVAVMNAPAIFAQTDRELRYRWIFDPHLGLKPAEVIGKRDDELSDSGDFRRLLDLKRQVLESGRGLRAEVAFGQGEDEQVYDMTIEPLHDASGAIVGVTTAAFDITQRTAAENALRRYELLSEHSRDMILYMRLDDGRILEANAAAEKAYGYSRAELLNLTIHDLRAPSSVGLTSGQMQRANMDGILFETFHRRTDGSVFPVEVSSQGATVGGERMLVSIIRDITERKRLEAELATIQERFNKAFYASPTAQVISRQADGLILEVNERFEQLLGYSAAEVIGQTTHALNMYVDLTARQMLIQRLQQAGVVREYETHIRRKSGEVRRALFSAEVLEIGGEAHMLTIIQDITERKQIEDQIESMARFPRDNPFPVLRISDAGVIQYANASSQELLRSWGCAEGETVPNEIRSLVTEALQRNAITRHEQKLDSKTLIITFAPLAESCYVNVYAADITQQKQAEDAMVQYAQELARSNQELEQFAYIASHDLQEPLRKIESFGDTLLTKATNLEENQRVYLERMRQAAGRMRRLIDDLLILSRVATQGQPFETVDLGEIAANVVSDMELRIRNSGGQVELGALPTIEADPTQMRQLFQNLIGNALKYHAPDSPPRVMIRARRLPDHKIEIEIRDRGIGFDEQYLEVIFQPFQRLVSRSEYEGTGIGLAICRKIVQRHGGAVTARSAPGAGSVFVVTLPVEQPKREVGA